MNSKTYYDLLEDLKKAKNETIKEIKKALIENHYEYGKVNYDLGTTWDYFLAVKIKGDYIVIPVESLYEGSDENDEVSIGASYKFSEEDILIYESFMKEHQIEDEWMLKMIHSKRLRKIFEEEYI